MLEKILLWNPRIFTLFNVPVTFHISFFLFLFIIAVTSPMNLHYFLIAFASVIPHEFGHILAARSYGINCKMVVMTPLGGVALLDDIPKDWKKEFWITIWGPIVSLILGFLFLPFGLLTYKWTFLFVMASVVNFVLFLFNMFPLFPMDGGRLLRSVLHSFLPHKQSTFIAVRVSQFFGMCIGVMAIVNGLFMMALTMGIIVYAAQNELHRK